MDKVLFIDDDSDFLNSLTSSLNEEFEILVYDSPFRFIEEITPSTIKTVKAIVIDLHMPGIDGISLIKKLKEKFISMPALLILTEYNNHSNRLTAYTNNVSDFLCKSNSVEEILVRLKNAIYLNEKAGQVSKKPLVEGLRYDAETMAFKIKDDELDLTKIETRILYSLFVQNLLNKPKSDLIKKVWMNKVVSGQTLRSHLFNLNLKLNDYKIKIYIDDKKNVCVSS